MRIGNPYHSAAVAGAFMLTYLAFVTPKVQAEEKHINDETWLKNISAESIVLADVMKTQPILIEEKLMGANELEPTDRIIESVPTLEGLSPTLSQNSEDFNNDQATLHLQVLRLDDIEVAEPAFTNGTLAQTLTEEPIETPQSTLASPQDADKKNWPSPVNDNQTFWYLLIDQLEVRTADDPTTLNWDAISWVGGDSKRLWIKTEGDIGLSESGGEAEIQALYGQLVAPFWDLQAGLRYDRLYGPGPDRGRVFGVMGIQGLAPYLFEVDASLFISEDGDVSARLTGEYELLLTQQLILQPKAEINLAAQRVENFGVGSGLNDIELGLRLRYEISRKFAPYVGINWQRKFFETADLAREEDESVSDFSVLAGVRLFF